MNDAVMARIETWYEEERHEPSVRWVGGERHINATSSLRNGTARTSHNISILLQGAYKQTFS